METKEYNDPIYKKITLSLISRDIEVDDDIEKTSEIWEMPSGDIVVQTKSVWLKFKSEPYLQEFFFKKNWLNSIIKYKADIV